MTRIETLKFSSGINSLPKEDFGFYQFGNRELTLTFDDGPSAETTPEILKILEKFDLKAMFFLVGNKVASEPGLTNEILQQGHAVGSHSFAHEDLTSIDLKDATQSILAGHEAVSHHSKTCYFRFPYGFQNPQLCTVLDDLELIKLGWHIDTKDWATPEPDQLLSYCIELISDTESGIVLMHDTRIQTVKMLPQLLKKLYSDGFTFTLFR